MTQITATYPTFGRVTTKQFKEIILPLKNKLFRFALSFRLNEEDAKDVVQDVMIKTWQSIEDLSAIKNIEAWCVTLTRNKALDLLRKKGRNHQKLEDHQHISSSAADPLESTTKTETAQLISGAISNLPEMQNKVIQLRDIEGHSYKEIVALLDIEMNHLKVLLHRARLSVKKTLLAKHNKSYYSSN